MICLAHKYKSLYLCIVFFMVLDLRLSKDWVVEMTTFLFLFTFHHLSVSNPVKTDAFSQTSNQ